MTKLLLRLFVKNHENSEDMVVRASVGKLAGATGIVCNIILFLGKLIAGLLAGSVAIVADAVKKLSDASSSVPDESPRASLQKKMHPKASSLHQQQ